jgi:hypothetical protein
LTQILPLVLRALDDSRIAIKRTRLQAERQKILEEWELDE